MAFISWNRLNAALLLVVLLAVIGLFASRAQGGPLDPPGAPSPSDSVRLPGTPISSLPFVITQPGNYYLTRSITMLTVDAGITIQASDVTVDLMGFELAGDFSQSAAFTEGPGSPPRSGWVIRNGSIRAWGYNAIYAAHIDSSVFEDLLIVGSSTDSGAPLIVGGAGNTVRNVRFHSTTSSGAIGFGDRSRLSDCTIDGNITSLLTAVTIGSSSSLRSCSIAGYKSALSSGPSASISDCAITAPTGTVMPLGPGSTVTGCTFDLTGSNTNGIFSGGNSTFTGNTFRCSTNAVAIVVNGNDWVDSNDFHDCGHPVASNNPNSAGNTVTRNRCHNSIACVSINDATNDIGPVAPASSAVTNPWSNIAD